MDKIMASLDWDDLRVYLAVARSGSIRGAAKLIGKTHATVSRHIRSLEATLGSPLFERKREGQCLTVLGQRIMPLVQKVEDNVASIDRVAFSVDTGLAGSVKLSLSESLYTALLYKPIDDFMRLYPMIDLEIIASDQLSSLALRDADVVIRITKEPPDMAYGRKLAASPLAVYASQDYLSDRPKLDRWIAFNYEPARKPIIPARIVAHANSPAVALQLIRLGQGVGLLPCYLGDTDQTLVRLPEVDLIPDMHVWVLTHGDLRTNPRVRALMDHFYQTFDTYRHIIAGESN